jgi:hypothetical protein
VQSPLNKNASYLLRLPLIFLFVFVGGCQKLGNSISRQILECGDDTPKNAVKILDPNGEELSGDQLIVYAIHTSENIERVAVSGRGCVSAETVKTAPLAVSMRQDELSWAALIQDDVLDATIRLQNKSTLQPAFRCPAFTSGVVPSPLVGDDRTLLPHSIRVAGQELIRSLTPTSLTLPGELGDGPIQLDISYTDLFSKELTKRPFTCSLVLDRTPPQIAMSLSTSNSGKIPRVSPFENTTLRIEDSNPDEILYCLHPKDDMSPCQDRAQFTRGGPETSFRAPGEGIWCVIAQSRDEAGNLSASKEVCALSYQKDKIDAIRNILARSRLEAKVDPLAAAILALRAQKIYDTLPTSEEREGLELDILRTYWPITAQLSETQRMALQKGERVEDLHVNLADRQWLAQITTGATAQLVLGNEKGEILDALPKGETYHSIISRNLPDGRTTWVVATRNDFSILEVRDGKIKIGLTRSWPRDLLTDRGTILVTWNPVHDEFLLTMDTFTEGYEYYLCSAQSAEPCQNVPSGLVKGPFLHRFGWSSQGQYLAVNNVRLKPDDEKSSIQVYERRGFGSFQLLQTFPETSASAFVKDTKTDYEYLVIYDEKGFSHWDPRSNQWQRKPGLPNYSLIENFSENFISIRQLLVRWDPTHIYASELNSKYFTLSFFDGNLYTDVIDAKSLNPGDFVVQNGKSCKGFRPAAMEGSDTFCVQSDVMRFRNVPFEALGQETWMYAAFNQGGVGVSKESVMHHFAAEPVLKSAPTGLNVFSRYLRYYLRWLDQEQLVVVGEHENQEKARLLNTKTQEVSDYNYQPQGEHPFQWQGHTYNGVQNLVDGGRSVVFPASDERSPPLTLKFSEDPANHFSLFTDGLETFFAARTNNSLQVYQLEEQGFALIKQIPQDPAKRNYVAWTDDGRYLLQYQTRKALLYERKGRDITFVSELTTPDQFLSCINTDPLFNRKVILSWQDQFICANGERISLMDPKSGDSTLIYQSSGPSEDRITDWRLSPDKRTLAVMNNSGKIMLFPMKASDQKKDVCLYLKDFFTSSNIFDSDPDFAREDQRLCE